MHKNNVAKVEVKTRDSIVDPPELADRTPFERMTELTRRIIAVPKAEVTAKVERKKRKHR